MQIQVRIDEAGALRNQRFAFSDRFTLVTELLQNARRAGATVVEVTHDPQARTLVVADDGCGIADFQRLLTLHDSGWSHEIRDAEHPFGVGFSKCLYAAARCAVRSRGRRVDIDTAAVLALQPVEVVDDPSPVAAGTRVELHGVDLPDLQSRIATLCAGFAVEVVFNGEPVDRPWAGATLPLRPVGIGGLFLCGADDGLCSHDTLVYLQGLCVMRPYDVQPDQVNVLHLDPRQFTARLPDRDKLIDEDLQRRVIDATLHAAWHDVLVAARQSLPAERFVSTYYRALRRWDQLELLDDVDVLPAELFQEIAGYPVQADFGERDYLRPAAKAPTRAAIEGGAVTLVEIAPMDESNAPRWMFARARGWLLFRSAGVSAGHWVHRHVRCLDDEGFAVAAIDVRARSTLDGRWVWTTVVLCAAVRITIGDESVEIADAGVHYVDTIYIPDGETSGEAVRQASDFVDADDQFMDADLDADRDALADLLRRLRSADPLGTLDSLLGELGLERYPVLHGRRFRLAVGSGPYGHAVELLG